jgi:hypothetical protein
MGNFFSDIGATVMGALGQDNSIDQRKEDDANAATANAAAEAVNPTTAAGMTAKLLRSQFSEWQKTYQQLSFNNPSVLTNATGAARTMAEGYSSSMTGLLDRQTRSLGVAPTTGQKTTSERVLNLDRAAAIAGAENAARSNVRTQDSQILLGTAPNPSIAT